MITESHSPSYAATEPAAGTAEPREPVRPARPDRETGPVADDLLSRLRPATAEEWGPRLQAMSGAFGKTPTEAHLSTPPPVAGLALTRPLRGRPGRGHVRHLQPHVDRPRRGGAARWPAPIELVIEVRDDFCPWHTGR